MAHRFSFSILISVGALALGSTAAWAQQGGRGGAPAAPPNAQAVAPVDFTGYWVSVITEDWRFRMVTPPKGDFTSVPLTPAGINAVSQWDPAKDIAAGEQCRAFGAGGIMRMPVRLHITWQDATALKIEIDNGNQTRLLHFDPAAQAPAKPDWQGLSLASWELFGPGQGVAAAAAGGGNRAGAGGGPPAGGANGGGRGRGPGRGMGANGPQFSGSLKVVTTKMRPGYVRRNGVPYSANATFTEYFDRIEEPNQDSWLVETASLDDPQYYQVPFLVTNHYKREPDGSKFNPRPCEVTMPVDGVHASN
jgi:hypothetical protein